MRLSNLPETVRPYTGKGKILRLKEGYNPNSSSLGSIVFSMRAAVFAVPVILSTAAGFLFWLMRKPTSSKEYSDESDAKK